MPVKTLGPPPVDTLIPVESGKVNVSKSTGWVNWFNLLKGVLNQVGPRYTVSAILAFPPIAPQSSQGLPIVVPGARPDAGMTVVLGTPSDTIFTVNWAFTALITADDEVTVIEHCYDSFGIGAYTGTFTVMVLT